MASVLYFKYVINFIIEFYELAIFSVDLEMTAYFNYGFGITQVIEPWSICKYTDPMKLYRLFTEK